MLKFCVDIACVRCQLNPATYFETEDRFFLKFVCFGVVFLKPLDIVYEYNHSITKPNYCFFCSSKLKHDIMKPSANFMVFASFEPQGPAGSLTNCFKVVSFVPLERKSDETDASSVRKLKKA